MRHSPLRQRSATVAVIGGLALAGIACNADGDDPDTLITDTDGGTDDGEVDVD